MDNLSKLRDIKSVVDVNDNSFLLFLIVVILCLIVIATIIFAIFKLTKKYKKQKYSFNINNSKETAYKLIEILRDKEADEYIEQLRKYTYKKEVPPFDRELFDEIIEKFDITLEK